MPRQPDPDLEERILSAAHVLWKRGGEKSLTMRAVARAARTNTPAVYRRFKDRRDLVRGLLLRIAARIRKYFEAGTRWRRWRRPMWNSALRQPHEYELFYSHARELSPPRGKGQAAADPGVAAELRVRGRLLAKRLGGTVEDSHATSARDMGDTARNDDAAALEIDPGRARRGVARGVPGRGEGASSNRRAGSRKQATGNAVELIPGLPRRKCRTAQQIFFTSMSAVAISLMKGF